MVRNLNSTYLYAKHTFPTGLKDGEVSILNFKDLKKLIRVFNCIKQDTFDLGINKNASVLSHKSPSLSFKLHLVDDDIINKPDDSALEKIMRLTFDNEFVLTRDVTREVVKANTSTSDDNKVYFYTKDGVVYAELTDMSMQDVDSIAFKVADSYIGEDISEPMAFDLNFFKILNGNSFETVTVKVITKGISAGVILFEIKTPETLFKYIVSSFKK